MENIQREYYKNLATRIWMNNASLLNCTKYPQYTEIGDLINDLATTDKSLKHTIDVFKLALKKLNSLSEIVSDNIDQKIKLISLIYEFNGVISKLLVTYNNEV